jgi:uncharacterized protein YcbK (DUF882 family)
LKHSTGLASIGLRVGLAVGLLVASIAASPGGPAEAREGNRTLKLHFGHTGERGEFTFKKNGRYDRGELAKINRLLRDWRRNEPARMDPQLLDLIWAIYKKTGSREYIHVVSAYRSPATNNMLRKRSSGVAKNSQHTHGKAMDFYIPGVPLDKLRGIAMKAQGGGVGYYPRSGSPFVHVDTGNVRAWPRMTRKQLIALFPNGETLHLPADGKPLPGYQTALAKRKSSGGTALAYLETGSDDEVGGDKPTVGGWLARVFDGGADEVEDNAASGTVAAPAEPAAPAAPAEEPAAGDPTVLLAAAEELGDPRLPKARPGEQQLALTTDLVDPADESLAAAIDPSTLAPVPRSRPDAAVLAASLGEAGPAPLDVDANDAIAALAALDGEAAEEVDARSRIELALAASETEFDAPSAADSAVVAGFAALDDSAAPAPSALTALAAAAALAEAKAEAPAPRARPVALAFAGAGLRSGEAAADAASEPATQPVRVSLEERRQAAPEPAYSGDADTLVQLIAAPAAHDRRRARFDMPQPAGVSALFAVPESADAVAPASAPQLPTDRFELTEKSEPAEPSFFSTLFASLVE